MWVLGGTIHHVTLEHHYFTALFPVSCLMTHLTFHDPVGFREVAAFSLHPRADELFSYFTTLVPFEPDLNEFPLASNWNNLRNFGWLKVEMECCNLYAKFCWAEIQLLRLVSVLYLFFFSFFGRLLLRKIRNTQSKINSHLELIHWATEQQQY